MLPRRREYLSSMIEGHLAKASQRHRIAPDQVPAYRRELWRMTEALDYAGLEASPKRVGEEEIDFLIEEYAGHLKVKTKRWYLTIFNGYLLSHKNHVVSEMRLGWPEDARLQVDWLSWEEAVALIDAARGPEIPLVHLDLRLLMRRCEVLRLNTKDVHVGVLDVRGKGRYGGKWRTLAWAPETLSVLQDWDEQREMMIEGALREYPDQTVPDSFLIYVRGGRLGAYKKSALDDMLHEAALRAGIARQFGHHTLRRSGARFSLEADPTCINVLMDVLGHKTEAQTRRYCGLTVDSMADLNAKVSQRIEEVRASMRGKKGTPKLPSVRISR